MTNPDVTSFFDTRTNNVSHIVADPETGACAIIDPLLDYDEASGHTSTTSADTIIQHINQASLKVEWVIDTHIHADHISAAPYMKRQLGGIVASGEHVTKVQKIFGELFNAGPDFRLDGSQFDHLFADGEQYAIGNLRCTVLHTPGHTPACTTHVIGDAAFVGDTLFMPDYGTARCDFPGGDARTLFRSIKRIFDLPLETRLFLNHDYLPEGRDTFCWQTTVAEQIRSNIHVHEGISEDAFVSMREERDASLATPKLMIPSVQVNMRAGAFPEADSNGIRYLKIPLDIL